MGKHTLLGLVVAAALFSGCASSPVRTKASGPSPVAIGIGSVAGAAIGAGVAEDNRAAGAAIGAAGGALVGGIGSHLTRKSNAREIAELEEQARREERVKVMNDYWYDQTLSPESPAAGGSGTSPSREMIRDEASIVEGVPYFDRHREVGTPVGSIVERPRI